MEKTIRPGTLSGEIRAISSKSHAHRLLICAALADRPTRVRCTNTNADVDATVSCLRTLGAQIEREGEFFAVSPIVAGTVNRGRVLDCGESGSTLRFMLPVVLALDADARLLGRGRLPSRPLSPLYETLLAHGAELDPPGTNPLGCRGTIRPGEYVLDGGVSSQFVSGLLFALPLLSGKSRLTVVGRAESRPYIAMTTEALRRFGVEATETDENVFSISPSVFRSPGEIHTEGDWSNAAFWLAAGAFSEKGVSVALLSPESLQGDRRIAELLAAFGAEVHMDERRVSVKRAGKLRGITVDVADIPDLAPILSVVAAGATGQTILSGCGRLRLKESDRIESIVRMLRALGGDVSVAGDAIVVNGTGRLTGGTVDSASDHRIAMAASIAAGICDDDVSVAGAEAVAKSYPGFYDDFQKLNGKIL